MNCPLSYCSTFIMASSPAPLHACHRSASSQQPRRTPPAASMFPLGHLPAPFGPASCCRPPRLEHPPPVSRSRRYWPRSSGRTPQEGEACEEARLSPFAPLSMDKSGRRDGEAKGDAWSHVLRLLLGQTTLGSAISKAPPIEPSWNTPFGKASCSRFRRSAKEAIFSFFSGNCA